MKQNIADILKEALKLPPEARAALAGTLLTALTTQWIETRNLHGKPKYFSALRKLTKGKSGSCPGLKPEPKSQGNKESWGLVLHLYI